MANRRMDAIMALAVKHGLRVVEDVIGAGRHAKPSRRRPRSPVPWLLPNQNFGASATGAVTTDDSARRARGYCATRQPVNA
jgi:hypothetical protein